MGDSISNIPKRFVVVQSSKPSNPFEGQIWVDTSSGNETSQYKNGSFQKLGTDVSGIKSRILEMIADIDENRYKNNLAIQNYDSVVFDTFVDSSKVASTSGDANVFEGASGNTSIKIPNSETLTQDYDRDGYSTRNGAHGIVINPNKPVTEITARLNSETSETFTEVGITETDRSNDVVAKKTGLSYTGGDTVTFSGLSLNSGTDYYLYYYKSGSFDNPENANQGYPQTGTGFDLVAGFSGGFSTSTFYGGFDQVTGTYTTIGSSGQVVSQTYTLDFTPSKAQLDQTLVDPLDTGEDVQYIIEDGNGNSKTITQSDVGNEVSVPFDTNSGIDITVDMSGDGSSSPEVSEWGVYFV